MAAPAPRREPARRMLMALGLGFLTSGGSHTNPGGQRLHVVAASSGEVVATWVERAGDDTRALVGQMKADLDQLSAEEAAARWVHRADQP